MPTVKMGWNTPFGAHKFDILLEDVDLKLLLAENGIDPARLLADHVDGEGKPDFITGLVQFRLLYLKAEYLSQTTLAFTAGKATDSAVQAMAAPAQQAATAADEALKGLLKALTAGEIR